MTFENNVYRVSSQNYIKKYKYNIHFTMNYLEETVLFLRTLIRKYFKNQHYGLPSIFSRVCIFIMSSFKLIPTVILDIRSWTVSETVRHVISSYLTNSFKFFSWKKVLEQDLDCAGRTSRHNLTHTETSTSTSGDQYFHIRDQYIFSPKKVFALFSSQNFFGLWKKYDRPITLWDQLFIPWKFEMLVQTLLN
jgi:hypothetical protein